ncbi:MAG: DnaJ domain-containing protein [Oscillospiraceae bacterium]|nr:DnaJ domain-containing protein [Oscillospiraceae bacterium]
MKNYYEILEVNENASQDIIHKVYKILAKKYHPDLQTKSTEIIAEKSFKELAEAYEILSNEEKRKKYDEQLKSFKDSEQAKTVHLEDYEQLRNYCIQLENDLSIYKKNSPPFKQVQKQAYRDAYVNTIKNLGYSVRHKRTFKQSLKSFMVWVLSMAIVFAIAYAVWHVPALKEKLTSTFGVWS